MFSDYTDRMNKERIKGGEIDLQTNCFLWCLHEQIPDLEKELVDLKVPSAEDVSRVLDSYQSQVRS